MTAASLGAVDRLREIEADLNSAAISSGEIGLRGACIDARNKLREIRLAAITPAAGGVGVGVDVTGEGVHVAVRLGNRLVYSQMHAAPAPPPAADVVSQLNSEAVSAGFGSLVEAVYAGIAAAKKADAAPPPADAVRALVAEVDADNASRPGDFVHAHREVWKAVKRAALSADPAGEETEQSIKADAYDMIAEALERAGLAGSSIVESVASLIAAAPTPDDTAERYRDACDAIDAALQEPRP